MERPPADEPDLLDLPSSVLDAPLEAVPTQAPAPVGLEALPGGSESLQALEAVLEANRRAVFDQVMVAPQALLAGQVLLQAVLFKAPRPGARPSLEALLEGARQAGLARAALWLPGPGLDLEALVAGEGRASVEQGPPLGALLALGLHATLGRRPAPARRNLTARLVAALPALERWSRAQVADYVHLACHPEDDARFWEIYLERVVIEVNSRAQPPPGPWLLPHLLRREARGIDPVPSAAWGTLKRHVDRLLHAPTGRARWARTLVERCHDVDMLHAVAQTPVVGDEPSIIAALLLAGGPAGVSCGLFALEQGRSAAAVAEVLSAGRQRPLSEVAPALAEIHAQGSLLERPGPLVRRLLDGVVAQIADRAAGQALDPLLDSVRPDPRAFRTSLLPVEAAGRPGLQGRPQCRQLRQRVLSTWRSTFTRGGISHPLNDRIYREAMAQNLAALITDDPPPWEAVDGLLDQLVERAGGLAEGADERTRLLGRFVGTLGQILRRCDQILARSTGLELARAAVMERVLRCWRLDPGAGAGWLGPGERALATLFGDLRERAAPEPARLQAAVAQLLALATPAELEDRPVSAPVVLLPPASVDSVPGARAPRLQRAPCRVATAGELSEVLGAYLGLPVLGLLGEGVGRVMGWQRAAEITLGPERLGLRIRGRRGAEAWEVEQVIERAQIASVVARRGSWGFFATLGAGALVTGGVAGGGLLYAGLRTETTAWIAGGVGGLVLGWLVDAALGRLARRRRGQVRLQVQTVGGVSLRLWLEPAAGAALLDELMAQQAEQAELAARGGFVEAAGEWGERAVGGSGGP